MSRRVTIYPEDFKKSSAQLAIESEKPLSQTAKDLGVNTRTLYGWIVRYDPQKSSDGSKTQAVHAEIQKLRQENPRLCQERDLLRKAAGSFAKSV